MSWTVKKTDIKGSWGAPSSVLLGRLYIFQNRNVQSVSPADKLAVVQKEGWIREHYVNGCSTKVSPTEVIVLDNRTAALYDVSKKTTTKVTLPSEVKVRNATKIAH